MDNNTLIIIAIVAVAGIVIGAVIGYLLGGKKDSGMGAEKAGAEAKSAELEKQLAQKSLEISRRDEQIERNQEKLVAAEGAKTEAETKLTEAHSDIADLRQQLDAKELERASYRDKAIASETKAAELGATNKAILQQLAEQKQFLEDADIKLRDAFASLSSEALRKNNTSFLEAAKESFDAKVTESTGELDKRKQAIDLLVKPLSESLVKFDSKLTEIEVKREGAYEGISTLLGVMQGTHEKLAAGTTNLVTALKTSHTRGKYGEISLKRLIESAGLTNYCDYFDQPSVTTEDGRLRPDCAVNLPGHRQLILDSKVPLNAYLQAFETEDEAERINHFKRHAVAVRDHFIKLSKKTYWEAFADAPDFVIMYMHIESSYGAALMTDTALIEDGMDKKIVFATPSTLLAILRTVGYMWQQEKMAQSVVEMQNAGIELYKRTTKMLEHFTKVGVGLTSAVNSYNNAVGSMESRVITQLAKIKEIGGTSTSDELPAMKPVETAIRPLIKSIAAGQSAEGDGS